MRAPHRLLIPVLAAGVLAVPAVADAAAAPPQAQADAALSRSLRRVVRLSDGPPGAAALIQRGAKRRFFTAGLADLRTKRRFTPSDHMRTASTGKALMGAAALKLVDAGVLSLNDTIAKWLPGLPAAWGPITLAQLLQHRSGLPEYLASAGVIAAIENGPLLPVAPRQLITLMGNAPLEFAPGSRYAYRNTDNIVAGLMIEAATGLGLRDELSERVFDPLLMRNTSLPHGYRLPTPFIRGYSPPKSGKREDLSEVVNSDYFWAAGGEASTQADFGRFIRAYAGPRYLKDSTRTAQRQWVAGGSEPPGPGTNSAGLAIFRYRTKCGTVYGHTGNFFGYTQFIGANSAGTRSVVVSANAQFSATMLPKVFKFVRAAFQAGVCAALAR